MKSSFSEKFNFTVVRSIFFLLFAWFAFKDIQLLRDSGIQSFSEFHKYFLNLGYEDGWELVTDFVLLLVFPVWIASLFNSFWVVKNRWVNLAIKTIIVFIFVFRAIVLTIMNTNVGMDSMLIAFKGSTGFFVLIVKELFTAFYTHFYGINTFIQILELIGILFLVFFAINHHSHGEWSEGIIERISCICFVIVAVLLLLALPGIILFGFSKLYFILFNHFSLPNWLVFFLFLIVSVSIAVLTRFNAEKLEVKILKPEYIINTIEVVKKRDKKKLIITLVVVVITIILVRIGKLGEISDIFKVVLDNDLSQAQDAQASILQDGLVMKNYTMVFLSVIISTILSIIEYVIHSEESDFFKSITQICINLSIQTLILPFFTNLAYDKISQYDIPTAVALREHMGLAEGKITVLFVLFSILLILFNIIFIIGGIIYSFFMGICMFEFNVSFTLLFKLGVSNGWLFIVLIYLISRFIGLMWDAFLGVDQIDTAADPAPVPASNSIAVSASAPVSDTDAQSQNDNQ